MDLNKLVLAMAFATVIRHSGYAAVVMFSPGSAITGDSDVNTSGTLVAAFNLGSTEVPSTTVNGVTFSPFALTDNPTTVDDYQISETIEAAGLHAPDVFGSDAPPFSILSASYQSLLSTAIHSGVEETMELSLNNLTIGQSYLLQLWTNFSNTSFDFYPGVQTVQDANGGDLAVMSQNLAVADGGTGHYTIGRFVADAPSQSIRINGASSLPILNAFQLRSFSGALPGDFDNDDDIDGRDFLIWQRGNSPAPLSASDLADWKDNYGLEFDGTSVIQPLTAVPEPFSIGLVVVAMLCIFVYRPLI